ncbi:Ferrochelatase [Planctomycetes bacterium Pla163]|uniref:Ferrochelatase n=1 Tax=Rohdeia mirabilis TaxID=2528008 RepID=A0A518CWY8_9BACT|nr:Ferrochelatase [Planctomycetes bacterium Pla163]
MRPGVLLLNLGTPQAPTRAAVKPYLRQFLSDPRVLDVAAPLRAFLGGFLIPTVRSKRSAQAYASIWTDEGSPLLVHSQALAAALRERLDGLQVELGMRYGEPSIERALAALEGCDPIVTVPLYPQYASSSTGTALEEVYRVAGSAWNTPSLVVVPPFYDHPAFIDSVATVAREHLAGFDADFVLFSYHGLPERHVRKSDPTGAHCLADRSCCDAIVPANASCYRAHCFATTRALIERMGLDPERTETSFQSRLGRDPWIPPFTDEVIEELAGRGVKRLAVLCPSFVADCLETVEEIGIEGAHAFREAGGEDFALVPCINAHATWADGLARIVVDALPTDHRA